MRRVPTWAMKMPKAWPMLASALNAQLGWRAEWKVFMMRSAAFSFHFARSLAGVEMYFDSLSVLMLLRYSRNAPHNLLLRRVSLNA